MRTASPRASACSASTRAEVAAAAGDQDRARHQRRSPRSRHQRTLARMPSNSATVGLVAELLARPRDVARDRVLQLAEHVQRPARSGRSPARARRASRRRRPRSRGTRSGRRFDTAKPFGRERVAHRLAARRAARTARRRRSSTRGRARRSTRLGEQHALHEVAGVHHRPALRARADEREAAPPDGGEELRLALGLERPVEPRRAHDDGREVAAVVAALHELLGLELRPAVAPCTGANGESSSKRSSLDAVRAERRVRRDVHEPRSRRPAGPGRARAGCRRR